MANGGHDRRESVFLSVAERHKDDLARPFRDLLGESGIAGVIVSDEPNPDGAFSPEEKVNAYLGRSDAVVVFATADMEAADGAWTRLNIADEIGRARTLVHLRDRVCVLKERGVILPSNIDPAYESLDVAAPAPAFRAALRQLRAWGFEVGIPASPEPAPTARPAAAPDATTAASADVATMLERGLSVIGPEHQRPSEPTLVVVAVPWPQQQLLRPAQLEDPALANRIQQHLLFGDHPVFSTDEATKAAMAAATLVIRQGRVRAFSLDGEGLTGIAVAARGRGDGFTVPEIVQEDVEAAIADGLRLLGAVLADIDAKGAIRSVLPVTALVGAAYSGWRTRAQSRANPTTIAMNIENERATVALHEPITIETLVRDAGQHAADLTILIRRAAVRSWSG